MKKEKRDNLFTTLLQKGHLLLVLPALAQFAMGCIAKTSDGRRRANANQFFTSLGIGEGRVFTANPVVLSGNAQLSPAADLSAYFGRPQFITTSPTLIHNCSGKTGSSDLINSCFRVRANASNQNFLFSYRERWDYRAPAQADFLQVNTFYHGKLAIERNNAIFNLAYDQANPLAPLYKTSVPSNLFSNSGHWYSNSIQSSLPLLLEAFADCDINDTASFDPARFQICLGRDSVFPTLKYAQDPSIIYHEFGHAFQQIALNARTSVSTSPVLIERVNLGVLSYDEAGSIGEGLSDYWSYLLTPGNRKHFAEWALGVNNKQSRPISESDPMHIAGINDDAFSRLAYPAFLNYDANFPHSNIEDIHLAGQIASHFLVALTEEFKTVCQMTAAQEAANNVMYLVNETLMELGDLTSKGTDIGGVNRINLSATHAKEWVEKANPINFKTFFHTLASKIWVTFGNGSGFSKCSNGPSGHYPKDNLEKLLDSYGLLLFVNYNEDGNGESTGHSGANTQINLANRSKTVLIPKSFIDLTTQQNTAKFLVFDEAAQILDALASLNGRGQISNISPLIADDLRYNNGNGRFSPGEIAGLSFVLFNDANAPMAGVHVLGNDWDHTKSENGKEKMCPNLGDNFPTPLEGAADITSESGATPGECSYITRNNGSDGDAIAPICFVQVKENSTTVWASQNTLRVNMGLEPHQCLGGTNGNNDDCFVRVIKGADHAFFSKIDAQKTWAQTQQQADGSSIAFSISNLIFFEISPQIPPTTKFICRFRVRFSNCSDCYNDDNFNGDNFLDYEFSGGKPFKIIHHEFTVTD